jgi:hypothetical protein
MSRAASNPADPCPPEPAGHGAQRPTLLGWLCAPDEGATRGAAVTNPNEGKSMSNNNKDSSPAPDHPDAFLLQLCAAFREEHLKHVELWHGQPPGASRETIANAADAWHLSLDAVRLKPATTLEGLKAKAQAFTFTTRYISGDLDADKGLEPEVMTELRCARNLISNILNMQD